jgi:hypothetical protein
VALESSFEYLLSGIHIKGMDAIYDEFSECRLPWRWDRPILDVNDCSGVPVGFAHLFLSQTASNVEGRKRQELIQ